MIKQIFLLLFTCFTTFTVLGQYQIGLVPRESPDRGVYEKIAFTAIDIRYGSPSLKGREIWGNLAPYEQVWRAGANNATTVEFSDAVKVEGNLLAAGKYALFMIPKASGKWEVIFSKNANQWGAFSYKKEEDALRIEVAPEAAPFQEHLSYQIRTEGFKHGWIEMNWEKVKIPIRLEIDYLKGFTELVEERANASALEIQWVCYLQGAEFLIKREEALVQANAWLEKSQQLMNVKDDWNKQFYPKGYIEGHLYWLKAQLAALNKDYHEAISLTKQLQSLNPNFSYYQRKNASEGIDQSLTKWESLKK